MHHQYLFSSISTYFLRCTRLRRKCNTHQKTMLFSLKIDALEGTVPSKLPVTHLQTLISLREALFAYPNKSISFQSEKKCSTRQHSQHQQVEDPAPSSAAATAAAVVWKTSHKEPEESGGSSKIGMYLVGHRTNTVPSRRVAVHQNSLNERNVIPSSRHSPFLFLSRDIRLPEQSMANEIKDAVGQLLGMTRWNTDWVYWRGDQTVEIEEETFFVVSPQRRGKKSQTSQFLS